MAEMVCSALVQETVSRGVSFVLGKREEKASNDHLKERLEMAASELEFALERCQELHIRHLSQLVRLKIFKSAYVEAVELLGKHKHQQQQAVRAAEQELQDAHRVKRKRRWALCANNMSFTSPFAGLSTDDVRRFEWFADCAGKFVRDVESGCSLHHNTFSNPIVRHLLQGKTLRYSHCEQGNLLRRFFIWPVYSDERGMEAVLAYTYEDSTMTEKNFTLILFLRLSESTDIVGVAIKGFQLLISELKLAAEFAMGELTMLSNSQDIAHSYGPPWVGIQDLHIKATRYARPGPACCKESRHGLCAKDNVSSGLADIFPEQVIRWCFQCYIVPALESSTRSSFDEVGRGRKPPLEVFVDLRPHFVCPRYLVLRLLELLEMVLTGTIKKMKSISELLETGTTENNKSIYAVESIGNDAGEWKNDVSIQEVAETIKSNAINCFSRQPELREYRIDWHSKHGAASFFVENASVERYNTRARTRRSSSRR